MPQSIDVTAFPAAISIGDNFNAALTFSVALTSLSTMQINLNNGSGFLALVGNTSVVSSTLAPDGLSAAIVLNIAGLGLRSIQFKETVSGVTSAVVPFRATDGLQIARQYSIASSGSLPYTGTLDTTYGSVVIVLGPDIASGHIPNGTIGGQRFTVINNADSDLETNGNVSGLGYGQTAFPAIAVTEIIWDATFNVWRVINIWNTEDGTQSLTLP